MTDIAIPQGLRVLVAEDEALVSMLIEDMLAEIGAVVVGPAATVEEALALASGDSVADVALLDVNLAGKPIFPVADVLRRRGVPFIFASGYGEAGIIQEHRGAPVLQKPFREADLTLALQKITAT
jgi:CheY-like chemotaxis protein